MKAIDAAFEYGLARKGYFDDTVVRLTNGKRIFCDGELKAVEKSGEGIDRL